MNTKPEDEERAPGIVAPTPNMSWFKDRAADLGTTLSAVSEAVLGYKFLLTRSLNGTRALKVKELPGLAQAFEVSLPVLLHHLGYDLKEPSGETALAVRQSRQRQRVETVTARYISDAKQLLEQYELDLTASGKPSAVNPREHSMPRESDERMAKLKEAINRCRHGDLRAMFGIEIAEADLITIGALAKASGDTFTHNLAQRLLATMKICKHS